MIPKNLQSLFNWTFDQNQEEFYITFEYPETFNPQCIEIKLSSQATSILVYAADRVPILAGHLVMPIKYINKVFRDGKYVISLGKTTPLATPFLINTLHEELRSIDPKSAFILFQHLCASENQEEIQSGTIMLQASAQAGYVPAMQVLASIYLDTPNTSQQGFILLKRAADIYDDPMSSFQVGIIYMSHGNQNGEYYLQKAAKLGFVPAHLSLGQFYSPLTEFKFDGKDPKRAREEFSAVVDSGEDLDAAYIELAKLLRAGLGGPKDEARAAELEAKAEEIRKKEEQNKIQNPNTITENPQPPVPGSEAEDDMPPVQNRGLIIGASLAAIGAFAYAVYRRVKNSK